METFLLRCYHASTGWFGRKTDELGLKTSRKGKYVKRDTTKAPTEAPHVPKPKRSTKSLADKTIDIFEGMTVMELAKRTGETIDTLQNILVNVGEKFESEFDPLSIDVAELVTMVFPFMSFGISHVIEGPIQLVFYWFSFANFPFPKHV